MPTELTPEEHIKVLQHEIEQLKDQLVVLTDKANQALISAESMSAVMYALIYQSKDRPFLLGAYLSMCQELDESEITKKRGEYELGFQQMVRDATIAHLSRK